MPTMGIKLKTIQMNEEKTNLSHTQPTLFDAAPQNELSANTKIHDAYIEIEAMTSDEYGNKGEKLIIHYSFANSLFGELLVASTNKGLCYTTFFDDKKEVFTALEQRFPKANFIQKMDEFQQNALLIFTSDWSKMDKIKLHVRGTDFQLKVWKALLEIPTGSLTTYGNIANTIQQPKAARAVGTAIGSNPIAFIIPCHRVIQSSGVIGGYRWGTSRKKALITWESTQVGL